MEMGILNTFLTEANIDAHTHTQVPLYSVNKMLNGKEHEVAV